MRQLCIALLMVMVGLQLKAQSRQQYNLIGQGRVQAKNYYLLTLMQQNAKVRHLLEADTVLADLLKKKQWNIRGHALNCPNYLCFTGDMKFSYQQINIISDRLVALYSPQNELGKLVANDLIPSGTYALYKDLEPKQLLVKAWEIEAMGINHTIAVYEEGAKPGYPDIDSISFKVKTTAYYERTKKSAQTIVDNSKNDKLFFGPSLTAALYFLNDNNRNDAANYEPMEQTVNKAPLLKSKTINWSKYPYTVIMVPGEGPEESGVVLSKGGKTRCRLAAIEYAKGLAPFIMPSGGKVHPYKTPYCEAVEMKKFLVDSLNIPANAVLVEPAARHTTTNMRNAARLVYRYGFPLDKPATVCTDKLQSAYISNMASRCVKELGYVPYRLGARLSDTEQEFYPLVEALQVNPLEPLDP